MGKAVGTCIPDLTPELSAYLCELTARVCSVLGENIQGLYLHGSASQKDFQPKISDIDVLGLVSGKIDEAAQSDLIHRIAHDELPVPATGLEFILCTVASVRSPIQDFRFEFAISTGRSWGTVSESANISLDTLIDLSVCRNSGLVLYGPHPAKLINELRRDLLMHAILEELSWHHKELIASERNLLQQNSVLNAVRAIQAVETGCLPSKTEGARKWLDRHPEDELVASALAARVNSKRAKLDPALVQQFITQAISTIEGHVAPDQR